MEQAILTEAETVRVLARLKEPNLLIVETAIATGARISEILGLTWRHVDLDGGVIHIVQRNWCGDIDDQKSKTSKRPLTLGYLVDRYSLKAAADRAQPDGIVFVRTDGSGLPLWDSGMRQCLKRAADKEGCDFERLGLHSFRRANITWRQEVGWLSVEASKIAGHSTVRITEEYTKIKLWRGCNPWLPRNMTIAGMARNYSIQPCKKNPLKWPPNKHPGMPNHIGFSDRHRNHRKCSARDSTPAFRLTTNRRSRCRTARCGNMSRGAAGRSPYKSGRWARERRNERPVRNSSMLRAAGRSIS